MGRSHGWGRAEAEGSGSNRQEEEAAAAFWGPFCSQLPDLPTLRVCTYLPTAYPPYYLTPNSVWVCMYRLYIENSNHFERSIKFLLLGIEFLAIFQESWREPRRNIFCLDNEQLMIHAFICGWWNQKFGNNWLLKDYYNIL